MDIIIFYLLLSFALLLLSAVFSASETAIFWLPGYRVESLAQQHRRGMILKHLYISPNYTLPLILLGNTFVNVLLSVTSLKILGLLHIKLLTQYTLIINILFITVILLIFGEFGPKLLAVRRPEKISLLFAPFIYALGIMFYPLVKPFEKLITLILKDKEKDMLSSSEILWMFYKGRVIDNVLKGTLWKIAHSLLVLGDTLIEDIMTPRLEIISLNEDNSWEDALLLYQQTGKSKIIIYRNNIDEVVGYLDISHQFLNNLSPQTRLKQLVRPITFIPATAKIPSYIKEIQKNKNLIILVKDEYGGTAGIITEDDLFEFMAGTTSFERSQEIISSSPMIFNGSACIQEISRNYGIHFEPKDMEKSIGKFILEQTGYIPSKGDWIKFQGLKFEILKVRKNSIVKVRILRDNQ
jgi:putative hemolysin